MAYSIKRPRQDESIPLSLLDSLVTEDELQSKLSSAYSNNYRSGSSLSSLKNARVGNFWKCVNAITGQGEWSPLPTTTGGGTDTSDLEADVEALITKTNVYTTTVAGGATSVDFGLNPVFVSGLIVDQKIRFYENPVLQARTDANDRKEIQLDKITDLRSLAQGQLDGHTTSISGLGGQISALVLRVETLELAMFGELGAFVALTAVVTDQGVRLNTAEQDITKVKGQISTLQTQTSGLTRGSVSEFVFDNNIQCSSRGITFSDYTTLTSATQLAPPYTTSTNIHGGKTLTFPGNTVLDLSQMANGKSENEVKCHIIDCYNHVKFSDASTQTTAFTAAHKSKLDAIGRVKWFSKLTGNSIKLTDTTRAAIGWIDINYPGTYLLTYSVRFDTATASQKIGMIAACVSDKGATTWDDTGATYFHLSENVNYTPTARFTLNRTLILDTIGKTLPYSLYLMAYYDKVNSSATNAEMYVDKTLTDLFVVKLSDTRIPDTGIQEE